MTLFRMGHTERKPEERNWGRVGLYSRMMVWGLSLHRRRRTRKCKRKNDPYHVTRVCQNT